MHVRYHLSQIVHQQTPMPVHPPRSGPLMSDLTNGVAAPGQLYAAKTIDLCVPHNPICYERGWHMRPTVHISSRG